MSERVFLDADERENEQLEEMRPRLRARKLAASERTRQIRGRKKRSKRKRKRHKPS